MFKRRFFIIAIFIVLIFFSLFIGASNEVTIKALLKGNKDAWLILLSSRLPRTVVIILSATSLSIAGLIMQSLSRNKFISPSTAGTTDAAAFGVLLGYIILNDQSIYVRFIFAFVFALLSSLLFITIINKIQFKNIVFIPLIGLMYGGLISALTLLLAYETNMVQLLSSVKVGSFSQISVLNAKILLILVPPIIFSYIYANNFNIVSVGEDFSKSLGVNYKKVLYIGLVITAIISASTFIIVGPLPFLGLIIPNIVSLYYGDNIKKNIIEISMFGSIFVLLNDIFSRYIIKPYELSVSFTMGITGSIIFMWLIFRQVRRSG